MKKGDVKEIFHLPPPYGGVSVYIKRLINKLNEDGFIIGGYYSEECEDENIRSNPYFDKWTWMQTSKFPYKIFKYLKESYPYKILHSHFGLEGMIYLYTIKTILRKKIIISVHNSMVSQLYNSTHRINRFFLKKMLKSKNVFWTTVNKEAKEQLINLPIKIHNSIQVIPAYVPISQNKGCQLASEMQNYINSRDKILTFYGHSFMMNKDTDIYGFETMIHAYSDLLKKTMNKNIGLIFCISDSSDKAKINYLYEIAKKNEVYDLIFWQIGPIDNMVDLWKQTDAYVRPTSTDGDSVAIREVLETGGKVVASNVVNRPEGVYVYEFGNNEDLIEKIIISLNSPYNDTIKNIEPYLAMKDLYQNLLKNK